MTHLIFGNGVNYLQYPSRVGGKKTREYLTWTSMLLRCTENSWVHRPTYTSTTCSENFKSYSYFYEWCNKQVGFGSLDVNNEIWQLDKDLLFKGNKVYSEDTCVFIPKRINGLILRSRAARGKYPIGVSWHKCSNKYSSSCSIEKGKQKYLGLFSTPHEAFLAYKTFKELLIKQVANEYKHQIDGRAYAALMAYEVNEND